VVVVVNVQLQVQLAPVVAAAAALVAIVDQEPLGRQILEAVVAVAVLSVTTEAQADPVS
jgi:hypothetical protein